MSNSHNNASRSLDGRGNCRPGDVSNTAARQFRFTDVGAYNRYNPDMVSRTNQIQNRSLGDNCPRPNTGRPLNMANIGSSGRNPSCSQDESDSCGSPSCPHTHSGSGRQLTRADIDAFARNTSALISESCSPPKSTDNQSRCAIRYQSPRSRNLTLPPSPPALRVNHEEQMARNQQIALNRLRAEQTMTCGSPSRATFRTKRIPISQTNISKHKRDLMHMGCSRGQAFDLRGRNILAGRRIDLDKFYNYNLPGDNFGTSGRPFDPYRDLPSRRVNLVSPKGQRASSCPTPMPTVAQSPPATRPAQASPRLSPSPTRSPNTSRSPSPTSPNNDRVPTNVNTEAARYPPPTPTIIPPTPVGPASNVTVTTTTRTTVLPLTPPRTQIPRSPTRSPDRQTTATPPNVRSQSPNVEQGIRTPNQTRFAPESPIRSPMLYPDDNRPQSPSMQTNYNVTNPSQPQSTTFNSTSPNEPSSQWSTTNNTTVNSTTPSSPQVPPSRLNFLQQEMSPGIPPEELLRIYQMQMARWPQYEPYRGDRSPFLILDTTNEDEEPAGDERYLHQNMVNNSSRQVRSARSPPPQDSFVDLTDETQYIGSPVSIRQQMQYGNQPMEFSERDTPTANPICPGSAQHSNASMDISDQNTPDSNCPEEGSWQEPQDDCQNRLNSTMNPSSMGQTFNIDDLLGPEFNYADNISRNKNYDRDQSCPAEPQTAACPPRGNLFRCLAKKLSSTYDFLSSFISSPQAKSAGEYSMFQPDYSQQSSRQNSCPYSSYNDSTNYDLERLFETQYNPNASTGTPGSIKECANAKRCGRVQFEGSEPSLDPSRKAIRKAQMDNLVDDTFCPGLIQGTLDGLENFNNHAFNITLGKDAKDSSKCDRPPPEEPMTLLEAFSMRIEQEREKVTEKLPEDAPAEQIHDIISKQFANKFPTDLNRSIQSLLLSERTKEYEQVEQAKEKSFESDVQKVKTAFPDNPKINLDVYTGHTKPSED